VITVAICTLPLDLTELFDLLDALGLRQVSLVPQPTKIFSHFVPFVVSLVYTEVGGKRNIDLQDLFAGAACAPKGAALSVSDVHDLTVEPKVGIRSVLGILQRLVVTESVKSGHGERSLFVAGSVAEAVRLVFRVRSVFGSDEDRSALTDGENVRLEFRVEELHRPLREPVSGGGVGLTGRLDDLVHRGEHLRSSRSV
jgi:hypothetical protein